MSMAWEVMLCMGTTDEPQSNSEPSVIGILYNNSLYRGPMIAQGHKKNSFPIGLILTSKSGQPLFNGQNS